LILISDRRGTMIRTIRFLYRSRCVAGWRAIALQSWP
jgi:hypothetical protein